MQPAAESDRSPRPLGAVEFRLAVVLLNYRTPGLVLDALEALMPEVDRERDVVVVVDNASRDGSVPAISARIEERKWGCVRLVEAATNGGFSAGNNLGIRSVAASTYLLLNSDTLVRPGAVEVLRRVLEEDPEVGIVTPRLEWRDGTAQVSCFRGHTPWSELIDASGTGPVRRLLERWNVPLGPSDEPLEPEWTSFAAVMIRREVFERAGWLDEGFFMYFEDVDYCRRAREAGWRIRHEPGAGVVHLREGAAPLDAFVAARERLPRYYYAARRRYFEKTFGRWGLLAANALWTAGRAIAWLRETFLGKSPHAPRRAWLDIWSH